MIKDLSIAVAIPTFNRNDDLSRCLNSLSQQTWRDFEIIIITSGDCEEVKKTVDNFNNLRIRIVKQQRNGMVEARNLGWRNSSSDIICFIDDDSVVSQEWLYEIKKTFLTSADIGGVSGPTIIPEERKNNRDFASFLEASQGSGNILINITGFFYKTIVLENKLFEVGKILSSGGFTPGSNYKKCLELPGLIEVDYLEACNMSFRRFLFEKIGGFSDAYTGTGEWNEPEFAFEVKKIGFKLLFNPKAITEHHISQSGVFKARTNAYERSRNFIYFYFRNIKPNNLNKFFRFGTNLIYINTYWCYKFVQTGNPDWLKGIIGTITGLAKEFLLWR